MAEAAAAAAAAAALWWWHHGGGGSGGSFAAAQRWRRRQCRGQHGSSVAAVAEAWQQLGGVDASAIKPIVAQPESHWVLR